MPPRLRVVDNKHLQITGLDSLFRYCLFRLPDILQQRDDRQVRGRLCPPTYADPRLNAEWDGLMQGELRHLLVSAGETVAKDLAALEKRQLTFPLAHRDAWMSALNQSRLILGELHKITEADMGRTEFEFTNPRDKALLEVHALGYLLQLFIEMDA
jgi:hypothetical protein